MMPAPAQRRGRIVLVLRVYPPRANGSRKDRRYRAGRIEYRFLQKGGGLRAEAT